MTNNTSTSLYYSDGKSDKEYHAQLKSSDSGYVVTFQYGRRGSTLRSGTKTSSPVDYEKAKKIYDKLIAQKMSKGYSPGEEGIVFQSTELETRNTGIFPQLLNGILETDLSQYLSDDHYWFQEKYDGERRLIQIKEGKVTGINRKGLSIPLPEVFASVLLDSGITQCVLDGEALGDIIVIFDILEDASGCIRVQAYSKRLLALERIFPITKSKKIQMITTARTQREKELLLKTIRDNIGEGIVIKKHTANYKAGRPNSLGNQLKFKFIESASVIVSAISENKRSVSISVYEKKKKISVGKVTIKANQDIPNIGDILEVQYLYAYKGGSLYQPVCIGLRTDLNHDECQITQLKFKRE